MASTIQCAILFLETDVTRSDRLKRNSIRSGFLSADTKTYTNRKSVSHSAHKLYLIALMDKLCMHSLIMFRHYKKSIQQLLQAVPTLVEIVLLIISSGAVNRQIQPLRGGCWECGCNQHLSRDCLYVQGNGRRQPL